MPADRIPTLPAGGPRPTPGAVPRAVPGVTFTVPGPPVGKGRARSTANGHHYTPQKTRNYEALVKMMAAEAMAGRPPLDCAVRLRVLAVMPIPASWSKKRQAAADGAWHVSRPDGANVLKAIEDGCNGIAYVDDSRIADIHVTKLYGLTPLVRVTVEPLA